MSRVTAWYLDYVPINLQVPHQSSTVQCETQPKTQLSNFIGFQYLACLSRYKSIIEKNFSYQWRMASACRFMFDNLKATSCDDRQTE